MKKGYLKILLFSIVLIMILILNSFVFNILSGYKMIVFLAILLIFFHFYFVLEKDRHRYLKDVYIEIIFYTVTFFMLFYLLGLFVGLSKTPNYLSLIGIKNFILPITLYIILKEILRYNMLNKADGNRICTIVVVILMILFDLTDDIYYASFSTNYEILKFASITFLPVIAKNVSYSYISKRMGYKPVIAFDLIFTLYVYILPFIPNPTEYVTAIIYLLIPIIFAYRIVNFFKSKEDREIPSDYHKKKFQGILVPCIIVLVLIYFYSGYFRYYAIAIASGSMEPEISKGDLVIIDQKNNKDLEVGQVMAFKYDNVIIVHRIVKIINDGNTRLYYTKGDNNDNIDNFVTEEDMILGSVNTKISYLGIPTVWFNE